MISRRLAAAGAALILVALAGCGSGGGGNGSHDAPADAVATRADGGPVVRLPAAPGRPGAGYLTLEQAPGEGALVAVASPRAGRIEIHETRETDGVASMARVERVPYRDGRIVMAPGGLHLMLYDLDPALEPGAAIELVLSFEGGATRRVEARVEAPGGGHPGH